VLFGVIALIMDKYLERTTGKSDKSFGGFMRRRYVMKTPASCTACAWILVQWNAVAS
jgi:hypothetical protein